MSDDDCTGSNRVCDVDSGNCTCVDGYIGDDCSEMKKIDGGISSVVIIVAVVGAVLVGIIGIVLIWKSWAKSGNLRSGSSASKEYNNNPILAPVDGPSRIQVGAGGGYTKLPRRLVK